MPRSTDDRLMNLSKGLTEQRMAKFEASQVTKDQLMDRDSSVLGTVIGQWELVNRSALDVTPSRARSSNLSPRTYFGMKQLGYARTAANVEKA